jgi:hypothetical protein
MASISSNFAEMETKKKGRDARSAGGNGLKEIRRWTRRATLVGKRGRFLSGLIATGEH